MCGLIAAIDSNKSKKAVNSQIVEMYEEQYKRGTEGFGIISLDKNKKINLMRATEPAKFMFDLHKEGSSMMFVHHRTPTSTKNKISQTHPILVDNNILKYKYYGMHNGVIRNCDELKDEHEKMGFQYTTELPTENTTTGWQGKSYQAGKFNDSESLVIEMVLFLEGMQKEVHFEGSAAFLIIKVDKETNKAIEFIYGRHVNPLNLEIKEGVLTLASEGPGESIPENKIYTLPMGEIENPKVQELIFPKKEEKAIIISPYGIPEKKETKNTQTIINEKETVIRWTKEDQDDLDKYHPEYPVTEQNWDNVMDFQAGEITSLMEDFISELSEEGLAYTADIEEYLGQMKKILKEAKGNAISYYRTKRKELPTEEEIALQYTSKHYGKKVDIHDGIDDEDEYSTGQPRFKGFLNE